MYVFENGNNKVIVGDENVHVDYSMDINDEKDSVSVSLPAFNIHFYVENRDKIREQANISLNSFLRYWIKTKGWSAFLDHMLEMGFRISQTDGKVDAAQKKSKSTLVHESGNYTIR